MRIASILKVSATVLVLLVVSPCLAQSASPAPRKKRTVYTAPPTGSLLGGGYSDGGDVEPAKPSASTTLSASDKASFRNALTRFDAQSGTIVDGYELVVPAVKLQTNVPTETLRRQHEVTRLTYGELLVANSLANGSGKKFNDIIALKNKGQSWTQISKQLGINIDSVSARLTKAEESIRYAQSRKRERRNQNVGDTMRDLERSSGHTPGG
jgi:hypothetical protein